jgi:4-amino-4-deoxy-L-arabinose transferase-like glycosyltransferase
MSTGFALGRRGALLLAAAGVVLYVPWLGLRDLWYPDEPDIAEVARAMFTSGDWVAPRRLGSIWVDYPPLLYWAGTASSHLLGGMSEFSLRLPNALAAIALALATGAAGARWLGERAGLWAGFALLTFVQYVHQAVSYRPDVLLALAVGAGLFLYARGAGHPARWWPRIAGFVLLGLAMLAKGPLGLLLPGLVLTLWHAARREWRRLLELGPLALVALAVYLPWFVACARAMGSHAMFSEFYAQNVARFYSGSRGHERPVTYYLVQVVNDLSPWVLLLPAALVWIRRSGLWRDRHVQLVLWWFGTFFVVLSAAVTKRQLYLLPAYPAAALILAPWLAAVGRAAPAAGGPSPRPARLYVAAATLVALALGLIAIAAAAGLEPLAPRLRLDATHLALARSLRLPLLVLGLLLLAAACWIGRAWRRGELCPALLRVGLVHLPLYVVVVGWIMPLLNPIKTYAAESRWIAEQIAPETRFGIVPPAVGYYAKAGAFGYYSGDLVVLLDRGDDVERFLREHPASLVLVHESRAVEIFAGAEAAWRARVSEVLDVRHARFLVVRDPASGARARESPRGRGSAS